jgi:hypothetical protein
MEYITLRAIPFEYTWEEGECHLFQTPPTNRRKKNFHPSPPEFTSESTPLPPEKKNHKSNSHHRNTQSFALMIYQYTACKSLP